METNVFPSIGNRPVGEIESREILDLLTPIWFAKAETARRVLQRIKVVFKSAILRGYRQQASGLLHFSLQRRIRRTCNHTNR